MILNHETNNQNQQNEIPPDQLRTVSHAGDMALQATVEASNIHEAQSGTPYTYQLIHGHKMHDEEARNITDDQVTREYALLTTNLIDKMVNGVFAQNPNTGEFVTQKPDVVVFLDKSGRPVSWLVSEFWDKMTADPDTGEIPKKPDFKFVNIDREQWPMFVTQDGSGLRDLDKLEPKIIRSLRSIFVPNSAKSEGLNENIDEAESSLDNKTILIVDELKSSGATLKLAKEFFGRAFPTSTIATDYWMSKTKSDGNGGTSEYDRPVWYDGTTVKGRGIGDRDINYNARAKNIGQKLGRYFLSAPLLDGAANDPKTVLLRKEFKELAKDSTVPLVPILGKKQRLNESRADLVLRQDRSIEKLNFGKTAAQVKARLAEIRDQKRAL